MDDQKKNILIINGNDEIDESEISIIECVCRQYDLESDTINISNHSDLCSKLYNLEKQKFDYLYLASHGCESFRGSDADNKTQIKRSDFADELCGADLMRSGAVLFHSCCKGGLNQIAYCMFQRCDKLDYICGPRHDLYSMDLITVFLLFMYYIISKGIDPVRAAEKALSSTDVRLVCHDRLETEMLSDYRAFCKNNPFEEQGT